MNFNGNHKTGSELSSLIGMDGKTKILQRTTSATPAG